MIGEENLIPGASPVSCKAGFTLVEVMVATAILLVIVVMCSMVIQQQSGAFKAGRDKVTSSAALRTVMGILARDGTVAFCSPGTSFSGSSANLWAFTGEPKGAGSTKQKISYSLGNAVTRSVEGGGAAKIYEGNDAKAPISVRLSQEMGDGFPKFFTIEASSAISSGSANVSGHSYGPNKVNNTYGSSFGDDIWVGAKPE